MYVRIGNYLNFWGPYQIVEKLCFLFRKPDGEMPLWVDKLSERLAHKHDGSDTLFYKFLNWIHSKRERDIRVKIHDYDSWNADSTLAIIALPLLKQLRERKHGSGLVALEDVPENLRYTNFEDYEPQHCFDWYHNDEELNSQNTECDVHTRWEWVLDEIIWALEQEQPDCDWESQYWRVKPELDLTRHLDDGCVSPVRWKVHGECDWDGRMKHQERIDNGLRLMGVYFNSLWD